MNEWELQHELSVKFRNGKVRINSIDFELVCWELMFPSWSINDKHKKWNEPSIDFILYSEIKNLFLCVELKNHIKSRKELLSAYCQTTHRTVSFVEQFTIEKISKARKECFESAYSERGGPTKVAEIDFQPAPKVRRRLLANSFPSNCKLWIDEWNNHSHDDFLNVLKEYKENNEIGRYKKFEKSQLEAISPEKLTALRIENLDSPLTINIVT